MSDRVPAMIATHAGRLFLASVTRLLHPPGPTERQRPPARLGALAGCYHACLAAGGSFVFGWSRPRRGGPITVITTSPVTGAGLVYPPGAHGHLLEPHAAARLLRSTPAWTRLRLRTDSLLVRDDDHPAAPLDDALLDVWSEPFTWLVHATPIAAEQLAELAAQAAEDARDAGSRNRSPAYEVAADRAGARHRELAAATSSGGWRVHLLAGAATAEASVTLAGLLAAVTDLSDHGYQLTVGAATADLDAAVADGAAETVTGSPVLAALARPPLGEIPGVTVEARSTFTVTPPAVDGGIRLGHVLDRSEHPAGDLRLSLDSLVRHTFVTGATGSGKTTTVQHLLAEASRAKVPWLVIEPAKSEYRHRLPGAAVLRVGHPDTPALGVNPLRPADGFPLRTHADMVKTLLLAVFDAEEPFPQILAAAIDDCYRDTGWDLVLGVPANPDVRPRHPTVTDLTSAARRVIAAAGYGPEVQANVTGFVTVRLGALANGTAATFLNSRHQLDAARLLAHDVIIELDDVGDDTDKAVVIGALLLRLTQHLRLGPTDRRLRHLTVIEEAHRLLRRPDRPGAAAAAVESMAAMLAEISAYGEGLVIADQIPAKLIPDVVKNTAVKILHRLPGRDDRDAAGGAVNLTDEQSARLVSLPSGTAAVATDGMRHPALTVIPAPARPAAARPSGDALSSVAAPSAGELARARASVHGRLAFTAWTDLTVLAHLLALPAPVPRPPLRHWLGQLPSERFELAVQEQVWTSAAARTTAFATVHSHAEFVGHVVTDLAATLTGGSSTCPDGDRWRLSAYRFNPVRRALRAALHRDPAAPRHPDSDRWEREVGADIPGSTCAEQLTFVEDATAEAESAVTDPVRLLHGDPPVLATAAGFPPGHARLASALGPAWAELVVPGGWAHAYLTSGGRT